MSIDLENSKKKSCQSIQNFQKMLFLECLMLKFWDILKCELKIIGD